MATKTTAKKSPKTKTKAQPSQVFQFYLVVPGSDSILHAAESALLRRVTERLKGGAGK